MRHSYLIAASLATVVAGSVLAGDSCSCLGDIVGDGFVDGADLGVLLAEWGPKEGVADLNGDGVVDGADLGILLGAWGPCPGPVNDTCAGSIPLMLGATPFCTVNASTELPAISAPACAAYEVPIGSDIWFNYNPVGDGSLLVQTCNAADFDTALAVWGSLLPGVATCPTGGIGFATLLGCNDDADGCGLTSRVEVSVIGGNSYRVQVGGYFGDSGNGTLSATFTSVGAACFDPRTIPQSGLSHVFFGTTVDNPSAAPNLDTCAVGPSPAEWFSWTAPCDSTVIVTTCRPGTEYDTTIHVYRDSIQFGCDGILVGCNDDTIAPACELPGGLNRKSRVEFLATSGVTYNIRVGGFQGLSGEFELSFERECF